MSYLVNLKKIGAKATVLTSSIALVACGGGGGGYYDDKNSNSGNTGNNGNNSGAENQTKEATGITLSLDKNELNVKGDEVTIIVKAVDKDGGGVAGKILVLNIADYAKNGATSDTSEKTTDESGNASFKVKLDGSNKNLTELVFTTTIKGTTINNIRKVSVTGAGTVVQSQYELVFDTMKHLPVSGGETSVRIRAIDTNGGGVPNENIVLAVKDFKTNGVTIKGSSSAVTDNEGYASFTIVLPNGKEADRQTLISAGISLEGTLTESSGAKKTQISTVIVDSVKNVVSSLSISTSNNNKVDAVGGSINVVVKAKNPEGNPVVNKKVNLSLDDLAVQYGAKLVNQSVTTDINGEATFTIKAEANGANPTGQLLVTNGITINASLNEENSVVQTTKITVVSAPAEEVSYLNAVVSKQIEIKGGQATVTITAKDKNGGSISNKQITLNVPNSQSNGLTIANGSKNTTDNNGQATFTLLFDDSNISASTIENLLKNGLNISAGYTTTANTQITQTTKVSFYQQKTVEQMKEVQRLELSSTKGVVSSTNDTVQIKVRAIDASGGFAANKSVTIGLNQDVTANGVTLDGAATKLTDSSGYATYTLKVNAHNTDAIQSLVASGIAVAVSSTLADGSSVKQNMHVMVEAVTLDAVDVSYLTISADQMINVNKGQATLTVKAVDSNGGVLAGQNVTLNIADSAANGLTIIGGSKAKTDNQGKATFVVSYDGHITDAALLNKLKAEGVLLTATYQPTSSGALVTQTTRIRYYQQTANVAIKQLNINLSKGVVVAGSDSVEVTVQAVDENGQLIPNRKLNLALNEIAKNNGAFISGASSQTSNTGEATFTVKLAAPNADAISTLISAGLLVTGSAEQNDGSSISQTAKVMVAASASSSVDVAYLALDNLVAVDIDNNAERVVTVKAYNSSGGIVANKDIELSLSKAYSGIKIKEGTKLTTNTAGEAKFTLVYDALVFSSADKEELLQNGIVVSVKYGSVTQTAKAAFYKQAGNIQRMDLVVDKAALVLNTTSNEVVKTTVTLKDNQGKAIANRQVTLALGDNALQNGVSITGAIGGSTVVSTDVNGQAIVNLTIKPTTAEAIANLVTSGIGIGASAVQGDGSGTIVQNTRINVLSQDALNEVGYLTAVNSSAIATTGGSSTITVKAFNSKGAAIANKAIKLNLGAIPAGLNLKLDVASKNTDSNGEAQFTVTYTASTGVTAEQIKALLAGVQVNAIYTTGQGTNISQSTVVQFYADQVNIQRMDLVVDKAALVLNTTSNEVVKTTVTLKDNQGKAIANRQVTLALGDNALQNGVSITGAIGGSTVVSTDVNGQAIVNLTIKPTTAEAIANLVTSGIGIGASAVQGDGSGTILQNTRINVLSQDALNEVGYLTAVSSNVIATTGGSSTITVKAFNSKGTAIANKAIKLNLGAIPVGLHIKLDVASKNTDSNGEAQFTVTYTAATTLTEAQVKALVAGIQTIATHTSEAGQNVTQSTIVQFNIDENEVAKDASRIELLTSKGSVFADDDTFTFTVKVFDKNGNPLTNKKVGIGLNAAARENGVTLDSNSKTTNANGEVTFSLTVKALDNQKIENLVANGITLAASVIQADGSILSQNTQVMVKAPKSRDVAALIATPQKQTLSILGDTTVIAVKAVDSNGKTLVNKEVNFALSPNLSSRVKVDKTSAITDSQGLAYFTVTLADGAIDDTLLGKAITYAVTTYNSGSTTPINQIGKVNVTAPVEATNLIVSQSKDVLLASGDNAEVNAKLVDINGKAIKGYPVTLAVQGSAFNGVTISGANTALTDSNGDTKFKINLAKITGKQYDELLANGVDIIASITLANGVIRTESVHFDVNEAVSNYHIAFTAVSKSSMDVNGDRSIITVTLLDLNNQPVRNQDLTLSANNSASLIIGTPGGGHPTNNSDAQTVKTDSNGNAFFSVEIDKITVDKGLLLASGIELTASHTNEDGAITTQITRLNTFESSPMVSVIKPARYSLRILSVKPTLNVRNDISDVAVTLIDENGGGVANKYVTLALAKFNLNGASIVGPSGLTTDENGQAIFKVKIDETARNQSYPATDFARDDLDLTAKFSESGYMDATQISRIDIVQAVTPNPIASIVIGVNTVEVSSSSDGVYYTKNLSASVVDFDGKPLSNQEVTLDITPISYLKGRNLWALAPVPTVEPVMKWVFANQQYYPNNIAINNQGTPNDTSDDTPYPTILNTVAVCPADPAGIAVGSVPVKVVTFTKASGSTNNTVTYVTDSEGKFDFTIRYPKIYAQWLTVRIGASSTSSILPTRTTYDLGLPSMASDYSNNGTSSPNETSPYGTTLTCP